MLPDTRYINHAYQTGSLLMPSSCNIAYKQTSATAVACTDELILKQHHTMGTCLFQREHHIVFEKLIAQLKYLEFQSAFFASDMDL